MIRKLLRLINDFAIKEGVLSAENKKGVIKASLYRLI